MELHISYPKTYFIIDQQTARNFVQYSEWLSTSFPSICTTQIIKPLINSRILANHDTG